MHTFCFHVLLDTFALKSPTLGAGRFCLALLAISLLGTPFMMLAMYAWDATITPCDPAIAPPRTPKFCTKRARRD